MKKFEHLMIDLETMGDQSYSAIMSIAAVEFDLMTGETGKSYHALATLKSNIDNGLIVTPETIIWWMRQSEKARMQMIDDRDRNGIPFVLSGLINTFKLDEYYLWGRSCRFDIGLLRNAFDKMGYVNAQWDIRKERCVRTMESFRPDIKDLVVANNTDPHNALSDCYNQIEYCSKIFNSLTQTTANVSNNNSGE